MFKMNLNRSFLFIKYVKTGSQIINYQTVRWRRPRKPFWLGRAKSKLFIIPEPKIILTAEEWNEFDSLMMCYSTQLRSLLNFIQNDNPKLKEIPTGEVTNTKTNLSPTLEKKIAESLETNEKWNAESAHRRNEMMKSETEKEMDFALKCIETEEEKKKKHNEMIEEIVRKEKVLSESFITPENLDEAIEKCLNNVECFDFAIDLEGKRYPGRESLLKTINNEEVKLVENSVA